LIYSNETGLFQQEILAAGQKTTGGSGGIRFGDDANALNLLDIIIVPGWPGPC